MYPCFTDFTVIKQRVGFLGVIMEEVRITRKRSDVTLRCDAKSLIWLAIPSNR